VEAADRLVRHSRHLARPGTFGVAIAWLFWEGIGVWGNNMPVAWAWDITNFVFWVGIGHAGTLISAVLFLSASAGARRSTAPPRR
jgi:hypothetical protein